MAYLEHSYKDAMKVSVCLRQTFMQLCKQSIASWRCKQRKNGDYYGKNRYEHGM